MPWSEEYEEPESSKIDKFYDPEIFADYFERKREKEERRKEAEARVRFKCFQLIYCMTSLIFSFFPNSDHRKRSEKCWWTGNGKLELLNSKIGSRIILHFFPSQMTKMMKIQKMNEKKIIKSENGNLRAHQTRKIFRKESSNVREKNPWNRLV